MKKRNIPTLVLLTFATSFAVGCSKKESPQETAPEIKEEAKQEESVQIINIEKVSFKDLNELRNFSKKSTSGFSKFLSSNKIENILAADGSIVTNKNMTYEKYTKNFNQLAYTQVITNYNDGVGYLKSGIKINFHMEETMSTSNNFAKAIFTIVNKHNPNITEEVFNEELKKATSDPTSISDYSFDLGITGMSLNVYSKPDINERELTLNIRQELEFPKADEFLKEYKTVKEFKDDSAKLIEDINKKVSAINETLKNSYVGKAESVEIKANSIESNETTSFSQSFELEYNAKSIDIIPDEVVNGIYECIEMLMTKDKLSKIISADDLKAYLKSLEIYSGLHTTGALIDETGEAIQTNSLPFLDGIIELSIGFEPVISEENETDENSSSTKKYNNYIKVKVNIPVQAEGIKSL